MIQIYLLYMSFKNCFIGREKLKWVQFAFSHLNKCFIMYLIFIVWSSGCWYLLSGSLVANLLFLCWFFYCFLLFFFFLVCIFCSDECFSPLWTREERTENRTGRMQRVEHACLGLVFYIKLIGTFKYTILRGSVFKENVVL